MKKDELFDVIDNDQENDVVELLDENGVPTLFNIIANLELDGQVCDIIKCQHDDEDVLIFKVTEENDEFVFETIEDEEELNAVIDAYNELLDEEIEE